MSEIEETLDRIKSHKVIPLRELMPFLRRERMAAAHFDRILGVCNLT